MQRPRASVPPEAIRIEDEVWQEAFIRREPARSRTRPRLQAIEGGRDAAVPTLERPRPALPMEERRRATAPRTAAAQPADGGSSPAATMHAESDPLVAGGGVPGRRTVTIRGHGAERNLPWAEASRRRPPQRAYERPGFKPDRVAMWAVLLGILLVVVAIASAHG
jgi:hypothetical protein